MWTEGAAILAVGIGLVFAVGGKNEQITARRLMQALIVAATLSLIVLTTIAVKIATLSMPIGYRTTVEVRTLFVSTSTPGRAPSIDK